LNRAIGHAYLIRDFSLQQAEIKPALPEMISDGFEDWGISSIPWLSGT